MEISSSKVNIMLNVAYANESGLTIYGYEDDYVVPVTDEKAITFTNAQNGTTKINGIVRLSVPLGKIVKGLVIRDGTSVPSDDIILEGAEIGDYTSTQGTYQINILSIGRGI